MKRDKTQWMQLILGWVATAEALLAFYPSLYYHYSFYGSDGSYFSYEFQLKDLLIKVDKNSQPDESSIEAIAASLAAMTDEALKGLKVEKAKLENAINVLEK